MPCCEGCVTRSPPPVFRRSPRRRTEVLPASAAAPDRPTSSSAQPGLRYSRPLRRRLLLRRRRRNAAERLRLGRSLCSRCRLGRLRSGETRLPDRRLCARRRRPRCARRRPHARQATAPATRRSKSRSRWTSDAPAAALCQGRFQLFLAIRDCRAAARPGSLTIHRALGDGIAGSAPARGPGMTTAFRLSPSLARALPQTSHCRYR